jgi:hypothetical protein
MLGLSRKETGDTAGGECLTQQVLPSSRGAPKLAALAVTPGALRYSPRYGQSSWFDLSNTATIASVTEGQRGYGGRIRLMVAITCRVE